MEVALHIRQFGSLVLPNTHFRLTDFVTIVRKVDGLADPLVRGCRVNDCYEIFLRYDALVDGNRLL